MAESELVVLSPHRAWPAWTGAPPTDVPDRELPFRLLRARGWRTVRLDPADRPWNPGARRHPLLEALDPLRAVRVLLRHRRAAAVFCNFESSALVMLLLRGALAFPGKVVVFDIGDPGWRLRRLVQDRVIPRADAVVVYSAAQAEAVRATWPGVRRVLFMQAQVDCRLFSAAPDRPDGVVLAVGDDGTRDYPTLLRAAEGLGREVAIRSRRLDEKAALPAGVRVLSHPLPFQDYRALIADACIVVVPLTPSVTAGGVSTVVEAMASGKAVVVTASPGIAEHVRDGETALVVPPHDPAALHAAIARLLGDAALRQRIGAAARAEAERRFSYEAYAGTLAGILDAVGAAPGGAKVSPAA